ncbi:MAG: glycosyltransferase [Anaerolineaceae bacterium]|nr:glycosyltransferase [Anaerolineaceae bacterium]
MAEPIRVAHIITDLDTGGAELALARLLPAMEQEQFQQIVISLTAPGPVAEQLTGCNIPVYSLKMRVGFPNPFSVLQLRRTLQAFQPHLVQTWMYHADLAGGLAARMANRTPVLWGIRNSVLVPGASKRRTIWIVRLLARLSHWLPVRIVSCSEAARLVHIHLGYQADKFVVIPNGFDLDKFRPDPSARLEVRQELNLSPKTELVGFFARFDPQKDHHNFIRAARLLLEKRPGIHFLLCGTGVTEQNPSLTAWIEETDQRHCFHLLGRREDMPRLTAALDIAVSASSGEAFPNVIGEAMACGVPCVGTAVGDSVTIIGNTGQTVPPHNPRALARAQQEILELSKGERHSLGMAARQRVEENYSLAVMVSRYQQLYRAAAGFSASGLDSDL